MQKLEELLLKFTKLNEQDLLSEVFNYQDNVEIVLDLNRLDQLYKQGIDSEGQSLGEYSAFTVNQKLFFRDPAQPVDRVTLKDTGAFYDSFNLIIIKDGIRIIADTIKDDTDLIDRYGENILGLTEENKELLRELLKSEFKKIINKLING